MADTIDLLEAIGQDASLRRASTEELSAMLEQAQASDALRATVASGDFTRLLKELGQPSYQTPQTIQMPGHEEDEPEEDEPRDPPTPSDATSLSQP